MTPWFRIVCAKLRGCVVVATEDCDGEVRFRLAHVTPFDTLVCKAIGTRSVILEIGGRIKGTGSYVQRWKQVWPK